MSATRVLLLGLALGMCAAADDPARDFSGTWTLDPMQSDLRALHDSPGTLLTITQQGATIHCTEGGASWSFRIDGRPSKYRVLDTAMNTETKWEGSALLINTLASGPQNYVIMERWMLSQDRETLMINRTIQRGAAQSEATIVYKKGERLKVRPPAAPPMPAEFVIPEGTKIALSLVNTLSTAHSGEGDRVYLETAFPVSQQGHIVIPAHSFVAGTVTEVKRAGRVHGKAELYLRFDSLTLPNGVTRDFRSRLDNSDGAKVDRKEGKLEGDGNKGGDARTIGIGTGAGAGVGTMAGHVGAGAAAGAAAGVAAVLLTRGPDIVLPKGTSFEMVLDRELHFASRELN